MYWGYHAMCRFLLNGSTQQIYLTTGAICHLPGIDKITLQLDWLVQAQFMGYELQVAANGVGLDEGTPNKPRIYERCKTVRTHINLRNVVIVYNMILVTFVISSSIIWLA